MKDLFLSYDKENEEYAKYLAKMLEDFGWSMWWDQDITEADLNQISCILTLFSEDAVSNNRIMLHASIGLEKGNLLPIRIGEHFDFPASTRHLSAADLTHWDGSSNHPTFTDLIDRIQGLIGLPKATQNDSLAEKPASASSTKASPQPDPTEEIREPQIETAVEKDEVVPSATAVNTRNLLTVVLLIMAVTFAIWYFTKYDSRTNQQVAEEVQPLESGVSENMEQSRTQPAMETMNSTKDSVSSEPQITNTPVEVEKETTVAEPAKEIEPVQTSDQTQLDIATRQFINQVGEANMTLNEKAAYVANNNSALTEEDINQFNSLHKSIVSNAATLKSDEDFVICGGIVERQPTLIKEIYPLNAKVWPWVKAHAPIEETLVLKWINLETNKISFTSTMKVKTQTNAGWRTWSAKTMKSKGRYEVRLYNSQEILIGKQRFQIQ